MLAKDYIRVWAERVNAQLDAYVSERDDELRTLFQSMRYSLLDGGKRLRPALLLASCEAVGGSPEACLPVACAVEMLHTYSLIHDDLPCMDDDDLRRGKPTNHKVFGEAMAVLAGDALLTMAFELVTDTQRCPGIPPDWLLRAAHTLASKCGAIGMVGGQAQDLQAEGMELTCEEITSIHSRKTAALLSACTKMGGIVGGGTEEQVHALEQYGYLMGIAFQITDDILDIEGDRNLLGKSTGSDRKQKKATYPGVVGIDAARSKALDLVRQAKEVLSCLPKCTGILEEFADLAVFRQK